MQNKLLLALNIDKNSTNLVEWTKIINEHANLDIIVTTILEKSNIDDKYISNQSQLSTIRTIYENKINNFVGQFFPKYELKISWGKPYEEIEKLIFNYNPISTIIQVPLKKGKRYICPTVMQIITDVSNPICCIGEDLNPYTPQKEILIPLDITKPYNQQLTVALELALAFKARLHIFSIDYTTDIGHRADLMVRMNKIKSFFEQKQVETNVEIIQNSKEKIIDIINERIDEHKPLFTLIMLRQESDTQEFYLGTIAQKIILNCHSPIITVKPWEESSEEGSLIYRAFINPIELL